MKGIVYHVRLMVISEDAHGNCGDEPMAEMQLVTNDEYEDSLAVAERIADLVDVLTGKE